MLQPSEPTTNALPAAAHLEGWAHGFDVTSQFVDFILSPYAAKDCIYLKSARTRFREKIAIQSRFSIPASCYIDSTGHFNAVELNICYNQMFYVLMADAIVRRQLKELAGWDDGDFKQEQLPSMLIVRVQSEFRQPIDPADFTGEAQVDRMRFIGRGPRPKMYVRTHATFQDAKGGLARGQIDFAIVPSA